MIYVGTRCLMKHNSYDEEALSDKIIEAENNVDLIKKIENEGYYYIGTNCCDGVTFIKNGTGSDEYLEFHAEKLGH